MSERLPEEFTSFLEDRVDGYLRSVLHYDNESAEWVYIRDDVQNQYSTDRLEEAKTEILEAETGVRQQEGTYRVGSINSSITIWDEAIDMYFFRETDESKLEDGVVVSMDKNIYEGSNIESFVNQCLEKLEK